MRLNTTEKQAENIYKALIKLEEKKRLGIDGTYTLKLVDEDTVKIVKEEYKDDVKSHSELRKLYKEKMKIAHEEGWYPDELEEIKEKINA